MPETRGALGSVGFSGHATRVRYFQIYCNGCSHKSADLLPVGRVDSGSRARTVLVMLRPPPDNVDDPDSLRKAFEPLWATYTSSL